MTWSLEECRPWLYWNPEEMWVGQNLVHAFSSCFRSPDANTKVGGNSEDVAKAGDDYGAETTFKGNDVETLLSQMHDLSFMLESNLSIPPTQQGSNSKSQDWGLLFSILNFYFVMSILHYAFSCYCRRNFTVWELPWRRLFCSLSIPTRPQSTRLWVLKKRG